MNEKKQGKFLDGFFWGAVIGGGLSYLLSTKKGRDFLKDIIQNGMDVLENATAPEPEMFPDEQVVEQDIRVEKDTVLHPSKPVVHNVQTQQEQEGKRARFFKKSPKK